MTVEAGEPYSSSMGPIVSGSRTPFRANAHRARAERSLWRRIGEDQSAGNGTILQPVTRCAFSPMSELGQKQTSRRPHVTSALPLKADVARRHRHVRLVPKAAVSNRSNAPLIRSPRRRAAETIPQS
jgi:hypothetical protein